MSAQFEPAVRVAGLLGLRGVVYLIVLAAVAALAYWGVRRWLIPRVERMAAGIDYFGVRKNEVYQTHERKVVGQFVGEKGFVSFSISLAFLYVLFAVATPVFLA